MKDLFSHLPAVNALVVFEAAARHMNFTRAAAELRVTQPAVSRMIRTLENELHVPLFRRVHRALDLTPQGRRLLQAVSIGLEQIAVAVQDIRRPLLPAQVSITTTIALASLWLMPRIGKFRAGNPEIDLKVIASDSLIDLAAEGVDLALRYGDGPWPGTQATLLFEIDLFPVCNPSYLVGRSSLSSAADLLHENLLHMEQPGARDADWGVWLHAVGIEAPPLTRGLHFNNYPLLLQAVRDGQGIALGWGHLVDDLLENGSLVRPIATTLRLKSAFYLVTPAGTPMRAEAAHFRDWIMAEAAQRRGRGPAS